MKILHIEIFNDPQVVLLKASCVASMLAVTATSVKFSEAVWVRRIWDETLVAVGPINWVKV